jgi:DNA-binding transcriptional regulator YdaS (Cro superfamily)
MTLQEYFQRKDAPTKTEFARQIGMRLNYLSRLLSGHKTAGPKWIPVICKATGNKVRPKDLNPQWAALMAGRF